MKHSFLENGIDQPEIVIGLVSAVGVDLKQITNSLISAFDNYGYDAHHIKVSKIIRHLKEQFPKLSLDKHTKIAKTNAYIDLGNCLRKKHGNDILAAFSVASVSVERSANSTEPISFQQNVFVIDQLKTESEIELLREVYGAGFFQVSVYSARDIRVDNLARIEAHSRLRGDKTPYRNKAEKLVCRDEDEKNQKHGQKVGKIFQLADFVVNADVNQKSDGIEQQVTRFVDLIFSSNCHSPSHEEYGMYLANSAALRSLDLSRQVGCAIFNDTGEIAALGTNEVPKAHGGTYWSDGNFDAREFILQKDSNDSRKKELINEIIKIVQRNKKLTKNQHKLLSESQFMDALEYGRIVHAEMCAITDAARLGISIKNGTIYCTTFPCHMCAKHIVAAGINKLVFLEPYPKSLTPELHSDSIQIEGTSRGTYSEFPSVGFVPFHGITPRRFREFFARGKRKNKDTSLFEPHRNGSPKPIFSIVQPWYVNRESQIMDGLEAIL